MFSGLWLPTRPMSVYQRFERRCPDAAQIDVPAQWKHLLKVRCSRQVLLALCATYSTGNVRSSCLFRSSSTSPTTALHETHRQMVASFTACLLHDKQNGMLCVAHVVAADDVEPKLNLLYTGLQTADGMCTRVRAEPHVSTHDIQCQGPHVANLC